LAGWPLRRHRLRNLAFIATMMDSGVEFIAVDNPHANKLTLHILAAVAQHEREMIAERTKAALQAAKQRGRVLGRNAKERLAPRYREEALVRASQLAPVLRELSKKGLSTRAIAQELTDRKIATPRDASWHAAGPAHATTHRTRLLIGGPSRWCHACWGAKNTSAGSVIAQ
jgi:DNA invertase Pin-like site-specific DNA recombinase